MNVFWNKRICNEQVSYECGLLWTGLKWTGLLSMWSDMNVLGYEHGLKW